MKAAESWSVAPAEEPRFAAGDRGRGAALRRARPSAGAMVHPRHAGIVERFCGSFRNPEELAYNRSGLPAQPLYRVPLPPARGVARLCRSGSRHGRHRDLSALAGPGLSRATRRQRWRRTSMTTPRSRARPRPSERCPTRRGRAAIISAWRSPARAAPRPGRLHRRRCPPHGRGHGRAQPGGRRSRRRPRVERSAFKARLLENGTTACEELGVGMGPTKLVVVENTPEVHNLVVCTLCSCYPRHAAGPAARLVQSRDYRSRAVREPRAVLAEFGTAVPDDVTVRVHDSTADMRYLVLPERPAGSERAKRAAARRPHHRDSMIRVPKATRAGLRSKNPSPQGRGVDSSRLHRRSASPHSSAAAVIRVKPRLEPGCAPAAPRLPAPYGNR